jgi:hypothetical protein
MARGDACRVWLAPPLAPWYEAARRDDGGAGPVIGEGWLAVGRRV